MEPPGKNDVTIRIAATAICYSDIYCIHAEHRVHPLPSIGGHEVYGYIEKAGEEATCIKPGDLAIATIIPAGYGHCYYYSISLSNQCQNNKIGLFIPGRYIKRVNVLLVEQKVHLALEVASRSYVLQVGQVVPPP